MFSPENFQQKPTPQQQLLENYPPLHPPPIDNVPEKSP